MRMLGALSLAAALVACAGQQRKPVEEPLEEPLGMEPDSGAALLARTRDVGADVSDARKALADGDTARAQAHLDRAAGSLSEMRRVLPGASLLRDLDDVGVRLVPGERLNVDIGPLAVRVEAEALFLDPAVVSGISQAEQLLREGKRKEAFVAFGQARDRLAADIGTPLVDDAGRQLAQAEDALKKGKLQQAADMLAPVGSAIDQVGLRAPLVPVRFDLRAAAASAELGDWERARRFVARAATRLEALQGATPSPVVPAVLDQTRRLERAIEDRRNPSSGDMRWLAARTRLSAQG